MPFIDALPTDWIGPGETATVDVGGRAVAIANVKGDYFAFDNQCPHQATHTQIAPWTYQIMHDLDLQPSSGGRENIRR